MLKIYFFTLFSMVLIGAEVEATQTKLSEAAIDMLNKQLAYQKNSSLLTAEIKSPDDLELYLMESEVYSLNTPFDKLTNRSQQRFINSLVFNENGLASFSYEDLAYDLSATEAYSLLSLFGAEHYTHFISGLRVENDKDKEIMSPPFHICSVSSAHADNNPSCAGGDYKDYYCASRATCMEQQGSICMSSC